MSKPQLWFCRDCRMIGCLQVGPVEDVTSVIYRMEQQHREASPKCRQQTAFLQSLVPENMREDVVVIGPQSI